MVAVDETEDKLDHHAIHVGHGQNAHDVGAALYVWTKTIKHKVEITPQSTIREHHTLGETCCAAGIVDECQLVGRLLLIIVNMLLAEIFGIFMSKHLV